MADSICMTEDYNQKGEFQIRASDGCLPVLKSRIEAMIKAHPDRFQDTQTPFVIADLGCATGASSINPCKTLIDAVREASPAMPIVIYLEDLPENHFNTTIMTVSEGLKDYHDIYLYCVGKSAYKKLFPNNSVDFIYSFTAIHWIEETPTPVKQFGYVLSDEKLKTEEGQKWFATARKHWKTFLSLREGELRAGGQLVTATPGVNNKMTQTDKEYADLLSLICQAFAKTLEKHGLAHLGEKLEVPVVIRREKDWTDIFHEENETNLKLDHYEFAERPFPFVTQYEKDHDHEKMVKAFKDFIKGFTLSTFQGALEGFKVDKNVAEGIITSFYESDLKEAISEWAQPPSHGIGYNILAMTK